MEQIRLFREKVNGQHVVIIYINFSALSTKCSVPRFNEIGHSRLNQNCIYFNKFTRQKTETYTVRFANITTKELFVDKIFIFTILHAKFVLLLHVPFVSSNLNALSTQRVSSTPVSAYGVYGLCLSLEV